MVWFKGLGTRKWSCRKPVASFGVNSWPEGGKLARLRYLQRLLPRTLLPLLLRCRFDLLRWWANIFLLSIKHTFVCSQIVSVSLLKRFTLRALTAAESFLNVTADMARDFVFGFRSLISMPSFVAAASSLSTARTFVPQWTIKAVFPSMWPDARNSFAFLWISLILAPREHSTIVFPLQARDNFLDSIFLTSGSPIRQAFVGVCLH